MGYFRVYPTKNTTIFKRNFGSPLMIGGNVNTGQNPIMEIHDGNSQSKLLFSFDISSIKNKLLLNSYTCNLKVWDAKVVFEPVLKDLKTIDLYYFTKDFVEGDGFAFLDGKAIEGVSNWNKRNAIDDWTNVFDQVRLNAFQLNSEGDDIFIEGLEEYVNNAIALDKNPNFALTLSSNTPDIETYIKFVYGRRTRTIFQPYLEFFIHDEINDTRRETFATKETKLYLVNQNGTEFIGIPSCKIVDEEENIITTITPDYLGEGVYVITYIPDIAYSNIHLRDIWFIGTEEIWSGLFKVKSPNVIAIENLDNMYFYASWSYTHQLVREGDIIKANLIAELRTKGAYVSNKFEFKVVCSNNFEMIPWSPINVYKDKMFFTINTSFFYPELEYEIIVRYKDKNITRSSLLTTKFRVTTDGPTHLAGRAANPYNDRNYMEK